MRTIPLLITVCLVGIPAQAKYGGGTGTADDPYQIATAADLLFLGGSPEDYDKHFILTADIDLDPNLPGRKVFDKAVIAPDIASPSWGWFGGTPFAGVFGGNQHKIVNLVVAGSNCVGLFGGLGPGAEVRDLGVVNVNASSSYGPVGALAGYNLGYVNRCYCTGKVQAYAQVGGLVGGNEGTVTASYSTASVSGSWAGGLVGRNGGGCVTHCYSAGAVDGKAYVGGLVGINSNGIVLDCYSTAAVRSSYTSYTDAGGLVGSNDGAVSISYSTGAVRATGRDSRVGGLLGTNHGDVTQCYATGAVSAGPDGEIGGLVGRAWGGSSMTSCFWDVQTSGTTRMCGALYSATVGCSDEYGKLTAQMRDVRTYLQAGWDFVGENQNGLHEAWQMPEPGGYPVLAVFNGYAPPPLGGAGTLQDPYVISSALELGAMIHYSPDAHYRLGGSIDLSGVCWGVAVMPLFGGKFDGNDLTISHLTIRGHSRLGLLGRIESGAQVTDLGVVDVNIDGSGGSVGAMVGQNNGDVRRCYSTGTVKGESSVGGLVGENYGGDVARCFSTGTVSGNESVGGLVGSNSGSVSRSYTTGAVDANDNFGGLVGTNGERHCGVRRCWDVPGMVDDSYSIASILGNSTNCGGLVGINYAGQINRCFSAGTVLGLSGFGGLVGLADANDVVASMWDTETSGQNTSPGGTGKTTAEMHTASTSLEGGWDFVGESENGTEDIWAICEGVDYPHLAWEFVIGDFDADADTDFADFCILVPIIGLQPTAASGAARAVI